MSTIDEGDVPKWSIGVEQSLPCHRLADNWHFRYPAQLQA
jgi:hypothetical protein